MQIFWDIQLISNTKQHDFFKPRAVQNIEGKTAELQFKSHNSPAYFFVV